MWHFIDEFFICGILGYSNGIMMGRTIRGQMIYFDKRTILKIVLGVTFAISIGFNFKFIFNKITSNSRNLSINSNGAFKVNDFLYDGRKFGNVTVNNYNITSNGQLKVMLSAVDQATGDSVVFASQATVEPAKFGTAIWGKDKWQ